jgi:hypothetical protein
MVWLLCTVGSRKLAHAAKTFVCVRQANPHVILTSSGNCPLILTFCVRTRGIAVDPVHFLAVLLTLLWIPPVSSPPTLTLCTYPRNSSGPSALPCGTPDVTLTSSGNCPPTLTLCVRTQGTVVGTVHFLAVLLTLLWLPPVSALLR